MTINNQILILGLFFFCISWFLTYLFIRSNTFFKVMVFAVSFALFIPLEQFDRVELTLSAFLGALIAYFGSLSNAFHQTKNTVEDSYFGAKDALGGVFGFFKIIFNFVFSILNFFFRLFQSSGNSTASENTASQQENHQQRNNQAYEEQSRRAKEEFRQAREEARIKEEARKAQESPKEEQDNRSSESIVGVNPGYTKSELKAAYRRSAAQYHPDKNAHMSEEFRKEAEAEFKKIQKAYNTLNKRLG